MKRINLLLTLLSLNAVLITVERFSFTTKIILQPYSFTRLHELVQISVITLLSIIISFFLFKEITNNFETLKSKWGVLLGVVFFIGLYFYATGNGLHEVASHLFNTFCDTKQIRTQACGSMFFNDYYYGNILYFIGLFLNNIALVLLEIMRPNKTFTGKDSIITLINGLVYAFMMFAYAAFDRVAVGLVFSFIAAATVDGILVISKKKITSLPFTFYSAIAYTLAAIAALIVRLH